MTSCAFVTHSAYVIRVVELELARLCGLCGVVWPDSHAAPVSLTGTPEVLG